MSERTRALLLLAVAYAGLAAVWYLKRGPIAAAVYPLLTFAPFYRVIRAVFRLRPDYGSIRQREKALRQAEQTGTRWQVWQATRMLRLAKKARRG